MATKDENAAGKLVTAYVADVPLGTYNGSRAVVPAYLVAAASVNTSEAGTGTAMASMDEDAAGERITKYDEDVTRGTYEGLSTVAPTYLAIATTANAEADSIHLQQCTPEQAARTDLSARTPEEAINFDLFRSFAARVDDYGQDEARFPNEVGEGNLAEKPPVFRPTPSRSRRRNLKLDTLPATPLRDPPCDDIRPPDEFSDCTESVIGNDSQDTHNVSIASMDAEDTSSDEPGNRKDDVKAEQVRLSFDREGEIQSDPDVIAEQVKGRCQSHGGTKCKFDDRCIAKLKLYMEDLLEVCEQERTDQYASYLARGEWWFSRLRAQRCRAEQPNGRNWKYDLCYRIEGREVCKTAFFVFYGYNPRNRMSANYVRDIHKGKEWAGKKEVMRNIMTLPSEGCRAWIHKYIAMHTDTPPVTYGDFGRAVVPASTILHRYHLYKNDTTDGGRLSKAVGRYVEYNAFRKMWKATTTIKLDGHEYKLEARSSKTKGYPKCDVCEGWHQAIMNAPNKEVRQQMRKHLKAHWEEVRCTRRQYAVNIAASKEVQAGWRIVSIAMDACDQAKTRIPLSSSDAKKFKALYKVKLKLTGVIIHAVEKAYHMYITPPWVKTGFNINATILVDLLARKVIDLQTTDEIRLQVDGASDNVCTYMVYLWTHYLLWAQETGLALTKIRVSRLIVGHTHFDVDQLFSVLSVALFGTKTQHRRRIDVYTLDEFKSLVRNTFGDQLHGVKYVGATYDYKRRYEKVRENGQLETGIKTAFVYELSTSSVAGNEGKVYFRAKPRMGERYNWTAPRQWYPHSDGVVRRFPRLDVKPTRARFKVWNTPEKGGAKVLSDYLKFADIPEMQVTPEQKQRILQFVRSVPKKASHVPAGQVCESLVAAGNGTGTHANAITTRQQAVVQEEQTANLMSHLDSLVPVAQVVTFGLTNAQAKVRTAAIAAATAARAAAAAVEICATGDVKKISEMEVVKERAREVALAFEAATKKLEEKTRKKEEAATKKAAAAAKRAAKAKAKRDAAKVKRDTAAKAKQMRDAAAKTKRLANAATRRDAAAKRAAVKKKAKEKRDAAAKAKQVRDAKAKTKRLTDAGETVPVVARVARSNKASQKRKRTTVKEYKYRSSSQFQVGVKVKAKSYTFGEEWARAKYGGSWKTQLEYGVVVKKTKATGSMVRVLWKGGTGRPLDGARKHLVIDIGNETCI